MTAKQRTSILAYRWPAACETQGWRRDDRDLRLAVIGEAIGREIKSLNDLDNAADIDRVFAHLGMLADDVARTVEVDNPEPGIRRRYLNNIRRDAHALGGEPYTLAIARDQFHITAGLSTLIDLTTEQLRLLMITIHARATARTKKQRTAVSATAPIARDLVPAGEVEENNCPF